MDMRRGGCRQRGERGRDGRKVAVESRTLALCRRLPSSALRLPNGDLIQRMVRHHQRGGSKCSAVQRAVLM